jgi:DNA processing protein
MKNSEELQYWVSLLRVSGVGPINFQKLLTAFGSPKAVFSANINAIKQAGVSQAVAESIKNTSLDEIKPDIEWLESAENHHIVTLECNEYPQLLKQISNPPPLLYVHGNYSLLKDPQLAIVGSRNPTQGGKDSAYDFAKYLAQSGLCISSGLALGIDGIAHQGALDADAPTIAVVATGVDRVYPARHRRLAHRIVEQGAIVSEFPVGVQPKAENFPRRNRIISGMSYGTLVIEAALQSGSLITARLASEQGREVFAIPGSIHNPLARGCHQLIRQGAKLVETAQDIFEEMASVVDLQSVNNNAQMNRSVDRETLFTEKKQGSTGLDASQEMLLEKMGYDPVQIDQLVPRTDMSVEEISAMLLILELQNYVCASGGGTYTRIRNT